MQRPGSILKVLGRMANALQANHYVIIAAVAALSLFPVYSGYFSLKYDNITFDLPMYYFMGGELEAGKWPVWFNTWNMGFPMQSVFCWSVFSTLFLSFATVNYPDPSIFHFGLVIFIAIAGMSFYKLLIHFATKQKQTALLLACCYMLSGFTFGSSQWIFYLSGMAIMPLCFYLLLKLLTTKTLKYALLFPVSYLVLFTNTHVFISVVCTYLVAGIVLFRVIFAWRKTDADFYSFLKKGWVPALSFTLLILLCLPPLWYSLELLPYLDRSIPITRDKVVFQSNFMHPAGLITLVLPQVAIKWQMVNTEGMMQSVYMGLITPILACFAIRRFFYAPDSINKILVIVFSFFLLVSFGHFLPLREALNVLPGFAFFRHPGLFRLFFIGFLLFFVARSLPNNWSDQFFAAQNRKIIRYAGIFFLMLTGAGIVYGLAGFTGFWKGSLTATIKEMDHAGMVLLGSIVQLCLLLGLGMAWRKRSDLLRPLLFFDLMLNGWLCLPFFTISSVPLDYMATTLKPVEGNPVQQEPPSAVPSFLIDQNATRWEHYNATRKKVSADVDQYNPLMGASVNKFLLDAETRKKTEGQPLVFFYGVPPLEAERTMAIRSQLATKLEVQILKPVEDTICFQQMNFPGWKVYRNGNELPVYQSETTPYILTKTRFAKGDLVTAEYKKPFLVFWSLLLNGVVLLSFLTVLTGKFRYKLMPFIRTLTASSITRSA